MFFGGSWSVFPAKLTEILLLVSCFKLLFGLNIFYSSQDMIKGSGRAKKAMFSPRHKLLFQV